MDSLSVTRMTCARIPTDVGEFTLCLYHNNKDDKEHLALVVGEVAGRENVLVRVHSECFTGDVLGSLRCDCGSQLAEAMRLIAAQGSGIVLYLRQEGRGIGLLEKLRAYNLQDLGYDTVDANLMLGHQPDLRDYTVAALILKDLGVASVRLLTNNPDKIASLEQSGVPVAERVPLQMPVHAENAHYLDTKVRRMRHLLELGPYQAPAMSPAAGPSMEGITTDDPVSALATAPLQGNGRRPYVTLSYAQSLDGSIAARPGEQTYISGPEALRLTHRLRAIHDAILIGIGTVLADDPQLTVRLVEGRQPQPIVVDSRLRFPLTARLLRGPVRPWIVTTERADPSRQKALEAAGARVLRLPADDEGRVDLEALLGQLPRQAIHSIMIEGGAGIIASVLAEHLADRLVLTIAPMLLGGLNAVSQLGRRNGRLMPQLRRPQMHRLGRDVVLVGELDWE
jgi:3,4-dihydroxy 2-butanone 4-phosphate synthase/GTP cyclohydrolase II